MAIKAPSGPRNAGSSLFDTVAEAVDLRKCFPFSDDVREFDRYMLDHCVGPTHSDQARSMLVYANGLCCQACGYKRSTLGAMFDIRGGNIMELAEELMGGPFAFDGNAVRPEPKPLNEDLAAHYHIRLLRDPAAYAKVRAMGFTDEAITHWRLGLHTVGVVVNETPVEYENQTRIVFPVFAGGKLRQLLYRKLDDEQRGVKIQMETGAGSWLINVDAIKTSRRVIYAEGWGEVIALWQLGETAVSSTNGAGHWNDDWAEDLAFTRELFVTGDADAAGQAQIQRIRKKLYWAKPLYVPFEFGTKGDWRDYVLQGGTREGLLRLLRSAPKLSAIERIRSAAR